MRYCQNRRQNMTKIKYMDFMLYKNDLIHYVHSAERHPNHYRDVNRLDYHIDRVVDSFIYALSQNQFEYDKKDEDVCGIIERLIKEYGCDENGVYTEEAHSALKNVYKYHGMNPENAKLVNRQPTTDWKDSFRSLGKAFSSFGTNLVISAKNLESSAKKFWNKGKKYILGGLVVGASLFAVKPAMNFFSSLKKQQPVEIKTNSEKKSVVSDTVVWQEVAINQNQVKQTKSDSVKRILENKSKYQNSVLSKQTDGQINVKGLSKESAENLEKACNCAPTIVINDLQKKGVLPADYRVKTLKKYIEAHPKSRVSEVPSRILLSDIHKVCAQSQEMGIKELSDYVNGNQKRFLSAMKISQKKLTNQVQQIKNLKQLRDSRNR